MKISTTTALRTAAAAGVDVRLLEQLSDHTPDEFPAARFIRIIKRISGVSPGQLTSKTRIAAGSRLLRETDRSIAGIAHECGFCAHSSFDRRR